VTPPPAEPPAPATRWAQRIEAIWDSADAAWVPHPNRAGRPSGANTSALLRVMLTLVSWAVRVLVGLRWHWFRHIAPARPLPRLVVVVVGNVTVGGAGKSPVVMALMDWLATQGIAAGVVSRGYGRTPSANQHAEPLSVAPDTAAQACGDEALLLRRRTGRPVWVHANRTAAVRALHAAHPDVSVVVCDDGLQHHGLFRHLEVCVIDPRGLRNGRLLPAGPLREPWPHRSPQVPAPALLCLQQSPGSTPVPGGCGSPWGLSRSLAAQGINGRGESIALTPYTAGRSPDAAPILAIAGIAQPAVFFAMLRAMGMRPEIEMAYPDHYNFDSWKPNIEKRYTIICTEKDAVKLWPRWPDAIAIPLVVTLESAFWPAFSAALTQALATAQPPA
jgi:tetraacyldisaccharide 4'-kinase